MDTHATADAEHSDHGHPTGWKRFVYSTNHKDIGTMYLVFAMLAGVIGGIMSIVIRMESGPARRADSSTRFTPTTFSSPRTA